MTPTRIAPSPINVSPAAVDYAARGEQLRGALADLFGIPFSLIDVATGSLTHPAAELSGGPWDVWSETARQAAPRSAAQAIDEREPLVVLALPLPATRDGQMLAVGVFVTRTPREEDHAIVAETFGLSSAAAAQWLAQQPVWPIDRLQRVANLAVERFAADHKNIELRQEVAAVSANIASTYEEITLLYRVTNNLRLSADDELLTQQSLEWLAETVPARSLCALLLPVVGQQYAGQTVRRFEHKLLTHGDCPFDIETFRELIEATHMRQRTQPFVANVNVTGRDDWPFPKLKQVVIVTLSDGDAVFGYLAAFNHATGGEFGSIEANLMASLGSILGVHAANIDLYRRRAELLTGIVRVLTSAIEAKDPYTCGHSDRVARVAVRIAQELGLDSQLQNTIYLSGLLHDIGKIGIDDTVLRKPGKLTAAEFEHIKLHPELGYKILVDLVELDHVLPIVLHHHENWTGGGYPHGLVGEDIPLLARIVAVADAFDAMGSDRPYRRGMPDDKVDAILRGGSGTQWDPNVVAAFFRVRDSIREIARREREALALDSLTWMRKSRSTSTGDGADTVPMTG